MKNWLKIFKKFATLPISERRIFIKVFFCLFVIKTALFLMPFKSFRNLYNLVIRTRKKSGSTQQKIDRISRAIDTVSAVWPSSCLKQALAFKWFFRSDETVQIVIGFRRSNNFEAHAWVQMGGQIIVGSEGAENFQKLGVWG